MEKFLKGLRRYISPVFLALLVASFILWYIAKLNYTYTTDQVVNVDVDGQQFQVTCVVEGVGTNLFGYRVYARKSLRIPLVELRYKPSQQHEGMIVVDSQSLQDAIALKFSDIKVLSLRSIPEIEMPQQP